MKRFYKEVSIRPETDGFSILLDNMPVRTPGRALLTVPTQALADRIAEEWRSQGEEVDPRGMRFTGMANAAIDRIAPDPAPYIADIARYAESDLFCYRALEPEPLVARQVAAWNPLLDWAERLYDVQFEITQGIIPVTQAEATLSRLGAAVAKYPAFVLAPLSILTTLGGSLVASLAIAEGHQSAAKLWPAVVLDELWQEEMWGADSDARKARAFHEQEWMDAAEFLRLVIDNDKPHPNVSPQGEGG
ncbi:ATPase [Pseudonocardia sp. TMWB2A]|uniref:ATP12 family chaperone protein n=1 Tax=Pseudonocardia sp. TMWB2A TaxID=687430 RepID=UPI00307F77B3